jgi:hypothetical protein
MGRHGERGHGAGVGVVSNEHVPAPVIDLATHREARANGGWRAAPFACACGKRFVSVAPNGAGRVQCPACGTPCSRAVDPVEGDPHEQHRRDLVTMLEDLLADVVAGHVDGAMFVAHMAPAHPDGTGWQTAWSGNLDFVTRLGGLELAKADMIHRANKGPQ